MSYEKSRNSIVVTTKDAKLGTYPILFKFLESSERESEIEFNINILEPAEELDFLTEVDLKEEQSSLDKFLSDFAIEQDLRPGVSAKIESISPFGEMIIRFNTTMNDKLNLTTLNSSVIDISL